MCGIVAYYSKKNPIEISLLKDMTKTLVHRGPNDHGVWLCENNYLGLGHQRLSIIDLSTSAHQPMSDSTKRYWITYNGEIYNFQEIKKNLENCGHVFTSHSDTEVILEAYSEWGESCLNHLRGMFAFVIWDTKNKSLFAARDRIGIKPLYYYWDGHTIIFASELRAIILHPKVNYKIDLSAVRDFLTYGYIPDPKSVFQNIYKLPPGYSLTLRSEKLQIKRYWDVCFEADESLSEIQWQENILETLKENVKTHLVSDVPIGAFLSGGVDSAAIVFSMMECNIKSPNILSVGFNEKTYNELPYAKQLCQNFGIYLNERMVTQHTLEEDIACIANIYDEPFGDYSALPTSHLCNAARKLVTVALSGDGGDENFAGYRKHIKIFNKNPLIKNNEHKHANPMCWNSLYDKLLRVTNKFFTNKMVSHKSKFNDYMMGFHLSPEEIDHLMPNTKTNENPFWAYEEATQHGLSDIDQVLRIGLKTVLPGRMLTKVDRASMANSLEVRVPLLDHHMVELSARIPTRLKLKNNEYKYIFRRALKGKIPDTILTREKQGFVPPIKNWFNDVNTLKILSNSILRNPLIQDTFNQRYLKLFLNGCKKWSMTKKMWDIVIFDRWSRRWILNHTN